MSIVTEINALFGVITSIEVDNLKKQIIMTDRQLKVFDSYYIQRKTVAVIADKLNCSDSVINRELRKIREKIIKVIDLKK